MPVSVYTSDVMVTVTQHVVEVEKNQRFCVSDHYEVYQIWHWLS